MTEVAIFECGSARLEIRHTAFYLGNRAPQMRISGARVVRSPPETMQTDARSLPCISVFTIPGHCLEELWLGDITQTMRGEVLSHPSVAIRDIAFLLECLDPTLTPPVDVVLDIVPPGSRPAGPGTGPIWTTALARSGRPVGSRPRLCGWLNLDERPQNVRLQLAGSPVDGGSELVFSLGPQEGALCETDRIEIFDRAMLTGQSRSRIVVLGR